MKLRSLLEEITPVLEKTPEVLEYDVHLQEYHGDQSYMANVIDMVIQHERRVVIIYGRHSDDTVS